MSKTKSYRNGKRTVHYDENGNKIGVSYESLSGGRVVHYDEYGSKTGVSYKSSSGDRYAHYDAEGNRKGVSYQNSSGSSVTHYDSCGNTTGRSYIHDHSATTYPSQSAKSNSSSATDDAGSILFGCLLVFVIIFFAVLNIIL